VQPLNLRYGGGIPFTLLHPLVIVGVLVGISALLVMRRKYVIVPVLLMAFLIPRSQQVVLGGLHISMLRIVILAGFSRALVMQHALWKAGQARSNNQIDKIFVAWALCHAVAFCLLYRSAGAVLNQFGTLWDSLGGFFLLRIYLQDREGVERAIKALAAVAILVACCMVYEHFTRFNFFALFELPGATLSEVRNGAVRARGPFAHPLLAGTFGATLVPLFVWIWVSGKSKLYAGAGLVASGIIVLTAHSSTPFLAYAAGLIGILCWPLRQHMRAVRWGILGSLLALHLVMKAPVWFIIGHIDLVGGSSSFHRAELVNLFITRFSDWWLVGRPQDVDWGWDMWDTCNQYVEEGETGGVCAFACFLALIVMSFKQLGRARIAFNGDRQQQWFFWLLGATLFSHVVGFFGISYSDQTRMLWYAVLAMITVATAASPVASRLETTSVSTQSGVALGWQLIDRVGDSGRRSPNATSAS